MAIAPFLAYITFEYLVMDFRRVMQLLSYVGVFLVLVFSNRNKPVRFPKYLLFYLFFILYVFYADLIMLDKPFKISYLSSNKLIGGFNFMLIIENLYIPKKHYNFIINISKKILVIAFLVILYQQVINSNFFMRQGLTDDKAIAGDNVNRLYSIYSWIGHILSCGLSFVPIFIIVTEELDKKKKKIVFWLIMGTIFAFLTKQRWLMLNFSFVFFLFFINYKYKFRRFIKYLLIVPVIIFTSFIVLDYVGVNAKGIVEERILESDKKDLSKKTASTRLLAFEAFNKFYWDNPITGIGNIKYGMGSTEHSKQDYKLKQFLKGRSSQIHVGYLSLLYMYGLIGAIFFLSFLYLFIKSLYINAKMTNYWGPFLAFLGFAVGNLIDVNFQVFEMGLIIALFANKFHYQNSLMQKKIYA